MNSCLVLTLTEQESVRRDCVKTFSFTTQTVLETDKKLYDWQDSELSGGTFVNYNTGSIGADCWVVSIGWQESNSWILTWAEAAVGSIIL